MQSFMLGVGDESMRGQLHYLMQRIFSNRVEIRQLAVLNQCTDYLVLLLHLMHPNLRLVLKLAGAASPMASAFDHTAMIHTMVRQRTTVPVPEILAVDVSTQEFPWRYLALNYIPGERWQSLKGKLQGDELSRAYRQLGEAVAQLHTLDFPAFGELSGDGSVLTGSPYPAAFEVRLKRSIVHPHLYDLFSTVLAQKSHLFSDVDEARLTHEDLHGYNLLFHRRRRQWQLAAVLDFDKAWAGHTEIDLARMEFWRGMTSESFWQTYQAVHPIDPGYASRRPIYQLLWCYEFARPTMEHYADTRNLCQQNGFPCPETFDVKR